MMIIQVVLWLYRDIAKCTRESGLIIRILQFIANHFRIQSEYRMYYIFIEVYELAQSCNIQLRSYDAFIYKFFDLKQFLQMLVSTV